MNGSLEATVEEYGYAHVLVAFETGAAAGAMPSAAAIEQHFLEPSVAGSRVPGTVLASIESAGLAHGSPVRVAEIAADVPPPPRVLTFPLLGVALGYANGAGIEALAGMPGVAKVMRAEFPSLIRPVAAVTADASQNVSWGVNRIGAPALWSQGYRGQGVKIGHIDTGIDATQPALAGAVGAFAELDMNGALIEGGTAWDSDDHGTHTAGTIVGRSGPQGAFGVAPEAEVVSAMVIEGGNVVARILGGMQWTIRQGIRIFSASLGLRGQGPAFQVVVESIRAHGVLPIIAVGNEGEGTSRYPGNYANVLSVGACDRNDRVADFSSSQQFSHPTPRIVPDLVAPGVDILSCVPTGFARMDGSSMATPHVAGLAALLFSAEPGASAEDVEDAILRSCQLPPGMDPQRGNRGIPDAVRALQALRA